VEIPILVVFSTIAVLAAPVQPGRLSMLPGLHLLAALRQTKILRGLAVTDFFIIAACKRGIDGPEFVEYSAPDEQSLPGRFFFQPSRGHNV